MNNQPRYYEYVNGKIVLTNDVIDRIYYHTASTFHGCCISWTGQGEWKQERLPIDFYWYNYQMAVGGWSYA